MHSKYPLKTYMLVSFERESNICYKIFRWDDPILMKNHFYDLEGGEMISFDVVLSSNDEDELKRKQMHVEQGKSEALESTAYESEWSKRQPLLMSKDDWSDESFDNSFNETTSSIFEYPMMSEDDCGNIVYILGVNGTKVPEHCLSTINWNDYRSATVDLLNAVFGEETLASHTLSRRQLRRQLDMNIVEDIITLVSAKCNVINFQVYEQISIRCNKQHMYNSYNSCLSKVSKVSKIEV